MKIILIKIIFLSFFISRAFANEDISKLNSLYLNGVLDQDTYFQSINNLGIDTSNEIFQNLFELFSDNVLDIKSYEGSLENLISVSSNIKDNSNQVEHIPKKSTINSKIYKLTNCAGRSDLCKIFNGMIVNFTIEENEVKLDNSVFDEFLADPEMVKIQNIKTFRKKDDFDIVISILHIRGILIDFVFGGVMKDNQFEMMDATVRGDGKELLSTDLEEI